MSEEPEEVSIRRGPYTAHLRLVPSDGMFRVEAVGIEKHREAVIPPQIMFMNSEARIGNTLSDQEVATMRGEA